MRLGYSIGSGVQGGLTLADHVRLVREAERLGYESAWASEAYGADPVALLGCLAGQTGRIGLGTGILQVSARSAVAAAMSAATIDQLSGGRCRLGLGVSGPQVVEGWHGQRFDRPLARLRDHVAVVRMALAGEPVRYTGRTLTLPLPAGRGLEMRLAVRPAQARLPVYVAAMTPQAIAQAGEIADGWLAIHFPPEHLAAGLAHARRGAGRAGRSLEGFDVVPMVLALVDEDVDFARDMLRPVLATYLGGMGSREVNFYNRLARALGFEAAAAAVQDAYLANRPAQAMDALPDELIDLMSLCGPPDRVRTRMAAYRLAGATTLVVGSVAPRVDDRLEQLRRIAELAA